MTSTLFALFVQGLENKFTKSCLNHCALAIMLERTEEEFITGLIKNYHGTIKIAPQLREVTKRYPRQCIFWKKSHISLNFISFNEVGVFG